MKATIAEARRTVGDITDPAARAEALARFVQEKVEPATDTGKQSAAELNLQRAAQGSKTTLGDAIANRNGVCVHEALLMKVLGDAVGLKVNVVRGAADSPSFDPTAGSWNAAINHVWTEVEIPGEPHLRVFDAQAGIFGQPYRALPAGSRMSQDEIYQVLRTQGADVSRIDTPELGLLSRLVAAAEQQGLTVKQALDELLTPEDIARLQSDHTGSEDSRLVEIIDLLKQLPPTKVRSRNLADLVKLGSEQLGVELDDRTGSLVEDAFDGITGLEKAAGNHFRITRFGTNEIPIPDRPSVGAGVSLDSLQLGTVEFDLGNSPYPDIQNIDGIKVKFQLPEVLKRFGRISDEVAVKRMFVAPDGDSGDLKLYAEVTNPLPWVARRAAQSIFPDTPVRDTLVAPIATLGPDGIPKELSVLNTPVETGIKSAERTITEPIISCVNDLLHDLPPARITVQDPARLVELAMDKLAVTTDPQTASLMKAAVDGITSIAKDGQNQITIDRNGTIEVPMPDQPSLGGGVKLQSIEIGSIKFNLADGHYPDIQNFEGLQVKLDVPAVVRALGVDEEADVQRVFVTPKNDGSGDFDLNVSVSNPVPHVFRKAAGLPTGDTLTAPIMTLGPDGRPKGGIQTNAELVH